MEEKILGFRLIKIDVLFFFTRRRPFKSDSLSFTFGFHWLKANCFFSCLRNCLIRLLIF